ncbi:glycosyltransferase family 9 protein [Actinoalloteichus hymeniacidonis]|uniref:ADP-heptose:LPS heptosyltransferase n=1 Tax=Actinoalloteichus hymeniacidonis TaxID=340345 RepID=A0AAC9HPD0_9PSEU|nr:glycosyltransferase family 9 protein [Actinoalloteichus hymeniacidonis]AOS63022.1 ADP-heptose:LPS heptosyltransferase [Actinoalloteichus hymeniacidonis]MBB5908943.1 ADP-heptose:LPS heptosyltransferase [Actinoalloteichus hymeniacidonis]
MRTGTRRVRHLVVLRALGIGDLLASVPALRGLREAYPDHRVVLATSPTLEPLVYRTGAVDEVLPAHGLRVLDWRDSADIVVNLHDRGPQSARILDALRPGHRIGHRAPGWDGPEWESAVPERERWCRLLAAHGVPADPTDLRLDRPRRTGGLPRAVVIHPGAPQASKRWPVERFAKVARSLHDSGHRVVITGSSSELPLAMKVAGLAGLSMRHVLAGRTDLAALTALIARARLLVCGDTGVAHLSYAFGTPSVVLLGPTPAREWGPPPGGPHLALSADRLRRGEVFADTPDPALLGVGTDWVAASARRLLTDTPRRTFAM